MSISSLQLDAFVHVTREKSFSRAADRLHITQSALSQRILNLERFLESTLFIRESSGLQLTEVGLKLLRYCQAKESLETEFLAYIKSDKIGELVGMVRLGGFSTVAQSILLPVLGDFIYHHPNVQVEVICKELRELPHLLESGQVDFICMTRSLEKQGVENHLLGYEEYVLIQSKRKKFRQTVYLDHDRDDTTTMEFFKIQSEAPKQWQHSYLDEIHLVIAGVQEGLGRAVVPRHLAETLKDVIIVDGYKPLRTPVYLSYYSQTFYTHLQSALIQQLRKQVPLYL